MITNRAVGIELRDSPPLVPCEPPYLETILALPTCPCCEHSQEAHLSHALAHAPLAGYIVECGVASGRTINHIADQLPDRTIWGFDSFEGLPARWHRPDAHPIPAGEFSRNGIPPPVRRNVRLEVGLFADTIPFWLRQYPGNIAFLHVDCDLYESAATVLGLFNNRIVPGTIIVFDDLSPWADMTYPPVGAWKQDEWRAMEEWAWRLRRRFTVISRLPRHVMAMRVLQ